MDEIPLNQTATGASLLPSTAGPETTDSVRTMAPKELWPMNQLATEAWLGDFLAVSTPHSVSAQTRRRSVDQARPLLSTWSSSTTFSCTYTKYTAHRLKMGLPIIKHLASETCPIRKCSRIYRTLAQIGEVLLAPWQGSHLRLHAART